MGNVVSIDGDFLTSIWDIGYIDEPAYQVVADAMSRLAKSALIDNKFLHTQRNVGTDRNFEDFSDHVHTWDHFFVELPLSNTMSVVCAKDEIGPKLSTYRSTYNVFYRSLNEITLESMDTVLDLISRNAIYRGEEHGVVICLFHALKVGFDEAQNKEIYVWSKLDTERESVTRIRNTSIGTLLVDLSNGVELDAAVRSFESKVAPTNYKRSTALVTQSMINAARSKIEEMGLTSALERRHAVLHDININDIIFVNRESQNLLGKSVFDQIPTKPRSIQNLDKLESISIDRFISEIVPNVHSIDIMFDNQHVPNLVSLIAPVDPMSGNLLKWDNRFSWSYNGDVTDSIKERVKAAGGNVTGDVCCRLSWFNYDDLDLHMTEPNYEIYFRNAKLRSPNGGMLDVDMNAGTGRTRNPVENIFYETKRNMRNGIYSLFVHQYQKRESADVGFEAEIDLLGTVYNFSYNKPVTQYQRIDIVKFKYVSGKIEILESLPHAKSSKTIWNISTNQFHKVNILMLSPNHWNNRQVGNKHYFFMLENCRNDGTPRGFYNEFLKNELTTHRKVFEIVGSKMKVDQTNEQLSGLGFSSTLRNEIVVNVSGDSFNRKLRVTI